MNVTREQISVALFTLISTDPTLKGLINTFTRYCQMWTSVPEIAKPQLLLFKGGPATEEYSQPQNQTLGLTKYTIAYNLWLYITAPKLKEIIIETTINNIADAIDNVMHGPNGVAFGQKQTLGGLVNNAWLDAGSEWSREFQDGNIVCMWRILVQTGI